MNYPHGRPEYLNEVCVNCGGERGLHNHMNQACPKDPNANRDHTEYRTTTFAAAQPSKVREIPDDFYPGKQHQRLFNWLREKGFVSLLSEMEEVISIVHEDFPSKVQEKETAILEGYIQDKDNIIGERNKEIERLKAWKQSAISVMPDMQAIGKALNIPLGQSVHDKILPGIERLNGLIRIAFDKSNMWRGESKEKIWNEFKKENNLT